MSTDPVHFDDSTLIRVSRLYYLTSTKKDKALESILKKNKLNNDERNQLVSLIDNNKVNPILTISRMKKELFALIGYETQNYYSTVARHELEAIYHYVMKQESQK